MICYLLMRQHPLRCKYIALDRDIGWNWVFGVLGQWFVAGLMNYSMNLLWNGIPPDLIKLITIITCTLFLWLPSYITCYMLSRQWIYEKYNDKDNEKEKEDDNRHDIDNHWGHLLNLAPGALCMACGAIGYPNPTSSCRPMESGLGKLFAFISGVTSKNQWRHNMRDDHDECPSLTELFPDSPGMVENWIVDHWLFIGDPPAKTGRLLGGAKAVGSPVHSLELAIY